MKQTSTAKIANYENAKWYRGLDFRVLYEFGTGENLRNQWVQTRREVAKNLALQASTMSGAVNRLLAKGYLMRSNTKIECHVTGKTVEGLHVTTEGWRCILRGEFYQ